ncbi:MAG: hypothetical protein LBR55_00155 [Bacteroidales bacterium]|jgi:hypothetical protein|nr:hypothetical protein [Bacteroidales bacterium]
MKKLMILSVSLLVICLQSRAQYSADSTKHYLSINDVNVTSALEQCVDYVYQWNTNNYRKNGIFNVYVSSDNTSISMRVIHYYPKNDSIGIMPDFYSYVDEQIVFWHMGKSHLSANQDSVFEEFVRNIYATFAAESDIIAPPISTSELKTGKRDVRPARTTIPAEEMKKYPITKGVVVYTLPAIPPTFLIKREQSGRVSTIEERRIR